jgi:hypothetical protein|tara:strand:- start:459 stop:749 length:291 start_codon:yes stop_codon:yes gene_type:complete
MIAKEEEFKESVMRDHAFSNTVLADNVNSPAHYGKGKIECIDYIQDFLTKEEYIGYLRGNIAKYLHRWRYKNKQEDLLKSQWYLDRLIHMDGKDKL